MRADPDTVAAAGPPAALGRTVWPAALPGRLLALVRTPETALLAAVSLVSTAATAGAPLLAGQAPVLLALLSPRLVFLLLAAPHLPLVPFVVLVSARLLVTDPLWWRIGRRCTPVTRTRLLRWLERRCGRFQRAAAVVAVAVRPIARHIAWAAMAGVPPRVVAAVDVVSTVAYAAAVHTGLRLLPLP